MAYDLDDERLAWDQLHGPEGNDYREYNDIEFLRRFPKGHNESLRRFVEVCGHPRTRQAAVKSSPRCAYLNGVHPRAWQLIACHGIDYKPATWESPWETSESGKCYLNAWILMRMAHEQRSEESEEGEYLRNNSPIAYVEGIVAGVLVYPMLHGWNAFGLEGAAAYDTTHYAVCEWSRYIGIPFTKEEYETIRGRPDGGIAFMSRQNFPRFESKLIDVLAGRDENSNCTEAA
jgi:hypothetical protein